MKEKLSLAGKRALVTGSSQGIGRSIAVALAEFGADVMVHCARSVAKAEAVCQEVEAFGVRSGVTVADLAEPEAAAKIRADTLAALGPVDVLVLNASVQIRKPWPEITREEYRQQLDVNLGASLWLIQQFVPDMQRAKWGRIVTLGSVQQARPHPEMLVYSATKAGLENLVRNLAPQLAPDGITINNLAPGAIATVRNEQVLADESYLRRVLQKIPAGFIGDPGDCAGLAVLLCSEAGRYITGQNLFVDGGMGLP
ncbi:MAG: SDR family oxidoreductase [Candidatus Anammoximicrobium sp.]|nr:SDR family oxidoreductase [Candidatus Anammoximicrobium sp.]